MGAGAAGGAQAGAAAAQFAIGMATNAAKRGVSYGFQMAGIGADALIEQLAREPHRFLDGVAVG